MNVLATSVSSVVEKILVVVTVGHWALFIGVSTARMRKISAASFAGALGMTLLTDALFGPR